MPSPGSVKIPDDRIVNSVDIDDEFSHLSAIMIDDDYYNFTIKHSLTLNGLRLASVEALVCLKAYAYINLLESRRQGSRVQQEQIDKHWRDVFRMIVLLPGSDKLNLPVKLRDDLRKFISEIEEKRPETKGIMKVMGAEPKDSDELIQMLRNSFKLS